MERIKTGFYKEVVNGVNYFIDAPNKTEAEKILKARIENRGKQSIEGVKESKIEGIKNEAKEKIESLEWKVSRHFQQRELGKTSLTEVEFLALLKEIQAIRDWSNAEEEKLAK